MTRGCKVCNKIESAELGLTFHRFPLNPERRKIWFALLEFKPEKVLPKSSYICSDHFERTDFHYKRNGLKYLNSDANPRPVYLEVFQPQLSSDETKSKFGSFRDSSPEGKSSFLHDVTLSRNTSDTSSVPSSSTSSDQISSDIRVYTIEEINLFENLQVDLSVAGPSGPSEVDLKLPKEVNIDDESSQGSSSTLTASEPSESGSPNSKSPHFKTKLNFKLDSAAKKRKHYIGDLDSSDFDSPEKCSKNLLKVKVKIGQQAKKIKVLQTINKRLRSRIKSLNELVKHMKGKALISESSE